MAPSTLPNDDRKKWVKRTREGSEVAPSAGTDILAVNNTHQCKLTRIEIMADGGGFFNVIVRDQDESNPTTRMSYRIPAGGGEVHRKGTFNDPIMNWGAKRQLTIQNEADAGVGEKQQAWITFWELKG